MMKLSLIAGLAGAVLMAAGCCPTSSYYSYPTTMPTSALETRVYPLLSKHRGELEESAARDISRTQAALLVKKGDLDQKFIDMNYISWVEANEWEWKLILTTTPAGHAQFEAALRALK